MTEQQNIFSVQFLNIDKYRFPKEHRLHLILILKGEVILSIDGGITYTMREGHTQIINSNYGWSVSGDNDNILIIISISPVIMFNQPTGIEQTTFEINCKQFPFETEEIAIRIKNIALLWIKKNSETWWLDSVIFLLEIFRILYNKFKTQHLIKHSNEMSSRISKVVSWIQEHYKKNITLNHIASQLHVSPCHLSRSFSEETGMSFRTFLTNVRFENAVKDIAFTTCPIGQIITENGFSSLHRFSVLFRNRYGITPLRWRQGLKSGAVLSVTEQFFHENVAKLRDVSSLELFSHLSYSPSTGRNEINTSDSYIQKKITLSFNKQSEEFKTRCYAISVGNLNELLKQHVQQQLIILKNKLSSFQVEINNPLQNVSCLYHIHTGEDNPTWSPWNGINIAFNFLKKNRCRGYNSIIPI